MAIAELSRRKKTTIVVFAFALLSVVLVGAFMETRPAPQQRFIEALPAEYKQTQEFSTTKNLQAIVKGSIYENGSNMTVFGACQDGNGYLLPNAGATFTAWYPNGSLMLGPNASMLPILNLSGNATGRWRIHVTMGDIIGTYFTELRCEYNNDYAIAFGEWQNPEWVWRIRNIEGGVQNLSTQLRAIDGNITQFQQDAQSNFTTLVNLVSSLNVSVGNITFVEQNDSALLRRILDIQRGTPDAMWVLDEKNILYPTQSQMWFLAADMVSRDRAVAVGWNGTYGEYAWNTWTYGQLQNTTLFGVSILDGPADYFWAAGTNAAVNGTTGGGLGLPMSVVIYFDLVNSTNLSTAIYSINGGSQLQPTDAWYLALTTPPKAFVDVELLQTELGMRALLLTDTGILMYSDDFGTAWSQLYTIDGGFGRLDVRDGVLVAATTGGGFARCDVLQTVPTCVGQNTSYVFNDVSLTRETTYLVGSNGDHKIWEYNGTFQELASYINTTPALSAVDGEDDDVWVSTTEPGKFYHYDGVSWQQENYAYIDAAQALVTVTFGNATPPYLYGVAGMSVGESYGIAVGAGGMVLRYFDVWDRRQAEVLDAIGDLNLSGLNFSGLNLSNLTVDLTPVIVRLDALNETTQYVLSNVTYTNQYIDLVLAPAITTILARLGIIEAQLNTTIELQNQTLQIVNETQQDIDYLINRSKRPRVWTTV